jgi:predicted alpha/beta superfamily hydrolase
LGARIALEAALDRPDAFGKVLAHSPSVWFNEHEILLRIKNDALIPELQLYIDSGGSGRSHDGAADTFNLRNALFARGFEPGDWSAPERPAARRLWHWFEPAHEHNETAWRERFPRALRALFPARVGTVVPPAGPP